MTKTKKMGGRPTLLRKHNLLSVTEHMRQQAQFSKIDLARAMDISSTTMGKLFNQLEAAQLIESSAEQETGNGRPKALFALSPKIQVAAVVIGIQETQVCLSSLQANIPPQHQRSFPTGKDRLSLFKTILKQLKSLEEATACKMGILAICLPGLIDAHTGKSILNPNLPFLEGSAPAKWFEQKCPYPCMLLHEEYALNRAQNPIQHAADSVISLDFSSGVGMCVIDQGKTLTGVSGFAGEIGHVVMNPEGKKCGCGNRGCLETMASDRVFQKSCRVAMPKALDQLKNQHPETLKAATDVLKAQAMGLAAVINLFNPGRIYVHSQLANAYPNYLKTLCNQTQKRAIRPSFEVCSIAITREGKLKGTLSCAIDALIETRIDEITK